MEQGYYDPAAYIPNHAPAQHVASQLPPKRPSVTTSRSSDSSYARSTASGVSYDTERRVSHESKPRLSKEQQDILEAHFQQQPKPSTLVKKGFSDNLGVPLDKINNWFQNRRAKVKQEAKKLHNAQAQQDNPDIHHQQQLIDSTFLASGHPLNDSSFVDSGFYNTISTMLDQMPSTSVPMHNSPYAYGDSVAAFRSGSHHFHAPHYGHQMAYEQGAATGEPILDDSPDVFNHFFGLEDMAPGMTHAVDPNALWAFSKQFNPSFEGYNGMTGPIGDIDNYNTSTTASSVMTRNSNNSSVTQLPRLNAEDQQQAASSSKPRSPTRRDPRNRLSDVQENLIGESNGEGMLVHDTMHMDQFVAMQRSQEELPLRPISQHHQQPPQQFQFSNPSHMYRQGLPQQPILLSQQFPDPRAQQAEAEPQSQHYQSAMRDPGVQMDTSVANQGNGQSAESETMPQNTSEVKPQEEMALKSPKASSSLAARRQRRPAALGTTALRSASYSNAVPSPSKPSHPASPIDANLRRIKSSTGVLNGRVQKSGTGSAPRSPMNLSFADGPGSPKFGRKISATSLNASATDLSRQASATPMTPQSPREGPRPPRSSSYNHDDRNNGHVIIPEREQEDPSSVWANMPTTAGTDAASVWSYMHNSESMPGYASPPTSPMDNGSIAQQMAMEQAMQSHYMMNQQVPRSAPAWQQTFQFPSEMSHMQNQHYQMMPSVAYHAVYPQMMPDGSVQMPQQAHMMSHQFSGAPHLQLLGSSQLSSDFHASPEVLSRHASLAGHDFSMPMQHIDNASKHPIGSHQQQQMGPPPPPKVTSMEQSNAKQETPSTQEERTKPPQPGKSPPQHVSPKQPAPLIMHEYQPPMAPPPPPASSTTASPSATSSQSQTTPKFANTIIQHEFPKSKTASPQQLSSSRSPSVGAKSPNGELMIHEYSPREPADPLKLPPRRSSNQPKEYVFSNHGPEFFTSP